MPGSARRFAARQASASVVELMRGEVERLEAVADDCRRRIERLLAVVDA